MELRGWSAPEMADNLHLARQTVTKALSLLTLPEDVKAKVTTGELPRVAAHEVAKLPDPATQRKVAEQAVQERLPQPAVAAVVRRETGTVRQDPGPTRTEFVVTQGTR